MSRPRSIRKDRPGFIEVLAMMAVLGFLAFVAIAVLAGPLRADSSAAARAAPSPLSLQRFVREARLDSCLPPDRSYAPGASRTYGVDQACLNRPWTPERQRRYCAERLDKGNTKAGFCIEALPAWAYPTLLLTKLPQLIDHICKDDADRLRGRYDQISHAFWRSFRDRKHAGLPDPYDGPLWFRHSEEIDC
ncbi:MAG TPA: hypothetical protein VIF43_00900 [Patescibacteria group bacterium]|jgi:hypothetical protein